MIQWYSFSLSRNVVEFSLKAVFPTMVVENLQIYGVLITGKCICKSKNLDIFTHSPRQKFLPQVLTSPRQRKIIKVIII